MKCADCKAKLSDKNERHGDRHCDRCQRALALRYTGSHESYRRGGDRRDLSMEFELLWARICDLTAQWDSCLAAVLVSNRDGLIGPDDAKDISGLSEQIGALSKRFHDCRERVEHLTEEGS